MPRQLRPATLASLDDVRCALDHLNKARDGAKRAGCPSLLKKIRSAIKSAGGAERHMFRRIDQR